MQYFKLELLKNPNADIEWGNKGLEYKEKFLQCCDGLPINLVKILKEESFHDDLIRSIFFEKILQEENVRFDIKITLEHQGNIGQLIHRNVYEFRTTLHLEQYVEFGDYLYGEFLLDENNRWSHDFLLIDDSEINIKCEKLEWIELSNVN